METATDAGSTNVNRWPPATAATVDGLRLAVGPPPAVAGASWICVPAVVTVPEGNPVAVTEIEVTPGNPDEGEAADSVMVVWLVPTPAATNDKHSARRDVLMNDFADSSLKPGQNWKKNNRGRWFFVPVLLAESLHPLVHLPFRYSAPTYAESD